LIKPVNSKEIGFEILMNSTNYYAFFSSRDIISLAILTHGRKSFYSPPPTDESTLFLDLMSIAVQKEFPYRETFNKL
jgi:hypothetical protein